MKQRALLHRELRGNEVVLHRGIHLHNVATSTTHVVVNNPLAIRNVGWALQHHKGVGAVLEGAAVLICVHLQLQKARLLGAIFQVQPIRYWVLGRGMGTLGRPLNILRRRVFGWGSLKRWSMKKASAKPPVSSVPSTFGCAKEP